MGAFDTSLKTIYNFKSLNPALVRAIDDVEASTAANRQDQSIYSDAVRKMQPTVDRIATEGIDMLGDASKRASRVDPLLDYERIRSGNLDAFNSQAKNIAGYKGLADKLAFAARGYVPGGRGSYEDILTTNRIASNLSPVLSGIFNNLGRDTSVIGSGRSNNFADLMSLLSNRQQYPVNAVNFSALPIELRNSITNQNIAGLGGLGEIMKNNIAGFKQKDSTWNNVIGAINDSVDTIGNIVSTYYTGGMMGSGGPKAKGGGSQFQAGFQAAPSGGGGGGGPGWSQYFTQPQQPSYRPGFNQGGGGGGSIMDIFRSMFNRGGGDGTGTMMPDYAHLA